MIGWIAFDEQSATAVKSRFGAGSAEVQHSDPLSVALSLTTEGLVLLPSSIPGKAVVARFRAAPPKPVSARTTLAFEPSGFLGLSDTPVFVDGSPPSATKKHWWER